MAPRVTVLMTAYNTAAYIKETIDSILQQTFTDFTLLVINDGSTDATADIVKSYSDPRLQLVDNKENTGLTAVLNIGLKLATGDYIARMDSDDIAAPHRLETQVRFMDSNPEVGIVGSWYQRFDNNNSYGKILTTPPEVGVLDLLSGSKIGHPTAMFRRSVFEKYGIEYESAYPHAEDYALWFQAIKVTKLANIQEVLLFHRCHSQNVSAVHQNIQSESAGRIREGISSFLTSDAALAKLLSRGKKKAWIKLFGIVPVLSIRARGVSKRHYDLFGFLPLLSVRGSKVYLFRVIPVATVAC